LSTEAVVRAVLGAVSDHRAMRVLRPTFLKSLARSRPWERLVHGGHR